ncbi:MAG: hypothetical protein IH898_04520, partial [Planctomycetes bacterium]|nr:hypothetical protein [Planctomycetota bacterium]
MPKPFRFPVCCLSFTPSFVAIGLLLLLAPPATATATEEGARDARAHMTRVWQEQFAAPQLFGAAPNRTPLVDAPPTDVAYPSG